MLSQGVMTDDTVDVAYTILPVKDDMLLITFFALGVCVGWDYG